MRPNWLANDEADSIYLAAGSLPDLIELDLSALGNHFVACVVFGPDAPSNGGLPELCETLLRRGSCYLSFFGKESEVAHDIADVVRHRLFGECENVDDIVLTTWDSSVSEEEIIFDGLRVAFPTQAYVEHCNDRLFLWVGAPTGALRLRTLLGNPQQTIDSLLDSEAEGGNGKGQELS